MLEAQLPIDKIRRYRAELLRSSVRKLLYSYVRSAHRCVCWAVRMERVRAYALLLDSMRIVTNLHIVLPNGL